MKYLNIVFAFLLMGSLLNDTHSQNLVTIGSGTNINSNFQYPAPYANGADGVKQQYLILASEIINAGGTEGDIVSIGFEVVNLNGVPLDNFTISMKQTGISTLDQTGVFETGLTTVYGPVTYTETSGWNTHVLDNIYPWDGISNIIIQMCFDNTAWSFTLNAGTYYDDYGFAASIYSQQYGPNAATVCSDVSGISTVSRPNIQLGLLDCAFDMNLSSGCSPLKVDFTSLNTDGIEYSWHFGDGGVSSSKHPSHTFINNSGSEKFFTVNLVMTQPDNSTCESNRNVTLFPSPASAFLASTNQLVMPDSTVEFAYTGDDVESWYWDFGDGGTSTEENPVYQYKTPGLFTLVLLVFSEDGCLDITEKKDHIKVIDPNAVGLEEMRPQEVFNIYPNPAIDKLTIGYKLQGNGTIVIYNLLGEQVYTSTLLSQDVQQTISLDQLSGAGLYLAVVEVDGERTAVKFSILR